jgi:hypothetical protein
MKYEVPLSIFLFCCFGGGILPHNHGVVDSAADLVVIVVVNLIAGDGTISNSTRC